MTLTLYQFPLSHYCEKARWALDHKELSYHTVNLLPGLHVKTTRRLAAGSSVPVLIHDGAAIQGSGEIISYLDQRFPARRLTPNDGELERQALEWEAFADEAIGVHVRRLCYHVLLEHPRTVIPLLTQDGPWYGGLMLKIAFPRLRARMRELMEINDATARASQQALDQALDRVEARLERRKYLVGNRFTRADLTVAALLAPLFQPAGYGLRATAGYPPEFDALAAHYAARLGWPRRIYERHR